VLRRRVDRQGAVLIEECRQRDRHSGP
jgi:hypothetical protein